MSSVLPALSGVQAGYTKRLKLFVMLVLILVGTGYAAYQQFRSRSDVIADNVETSGSSGMLHAAGTDPENIQIAMTGPRGEAVSEAVEPPAAKTLRHETDSIAIPAPDPVNRAVKDGFQRGNDIKVNEAVTGFQKGGGGTSVPGGDRPGPTEHVLHITNTGDKIIITDETNTVISTHTAFHRDDEVAGSGSYATDDQEYATQPADFEEVYPGCPQALPEGSDKQDAEQHLKDYGCRYRRSCSTDTDEQDGACTWYFTGR